MTLRRRFNCLALAAFAAGAFSIAPARADDAAVARGAYLAAAADCAGCHTDKKNNGATFAGGPPLATPFGTFYGPNITPDAETGIGDWTEAQFKRALHEGINEHGAYMYPVFPFPSFTNLTEPDLGDLYAYFKSLAPVKHRAPRNAVRFPFNWRPLLFGWRTLFYKPGPLPRVEEQSTEWVRGRYLAEAVAHCQECHTPRNILGALDRGRAYAGNPSGPDGQDAPNVTSDKQDGIGDWKLEDLEELLKTGTDPDGEIVGKGMADVVDGTAKLTPADRHALALYIKSLPALPKTPK